MQEFSLEQVCRTPRLALCAYRETQLLQLMSEFILVCIAIFENGEARSLCCHERDGDC